VGGVCFNEANLYSKNGCSQTGHFICLGPSQCDPRSQSHGPCFWARQTNGGPTTNQAMNVSVLWSMHQWTRHTATWTPGPVFGQFRGHGHSWPNREMVERRREKRKKGGGGCVGKGQTLMSSPVFTRLRFPIARGDNHKLVVKYSDGYKENRSDKHTQRNFLPSVNYRSCWCGEGRGRGGEGGKGREKRPREKFRTITIVCDHVLTAVPLSRGAVF
jgi:hypothetical protein